MVDRVINGLGVVGLELNGGDRYAVEEEDEINAVLVMERVLDLPRHPKPVGLVSLEDFFVEAQGWLELSQFQITPQPEDGYPATDDFKRSLLIELSAYCAEELILSS